jgi:hypothetical protein
MLPTARCNCPMAARRHDDVWGSGDSGSCIPISTLVAGKRIASRSSRLFREGVHGNHWIWDWACPKVTLNVVTKRINLFPHRRSNSSYPTRSKSPSWLIYTDSGTHPSPFSVGTILSFPKDKKGRALSWHVGLVPMAHGTNRAENIVSLLLFTGRCLVMAVI